MKKNTTTIIILLAAAGLGYYLWDKRRKKAAELKAAAEKAAATAAGQILGGGSTVSGGTTGSGSGTGSGTTTAGKINFTETELNSLLSNGKIGNTVKALQLYLKQASQNIGAAGADGVFGADTERALNNEIGKKTVTLKELKITGVNLTTGTVFGKEVNWGSIEGAWNGVGFF